MKVAIVTNWHDGTVRVRVDGRERGCIRAVSKKSLADPFEQLRLENSRHMNAVADDLKAILLDLGHDVAAIEMLT